MRRLWHPHGIHITRGTSNKIFTDSNYTRRHPVNQFPHEESTSLYLPLKGSVGLLEDDDDHNEWLRLD